MKMHSDEIDITVEQLRRLLAEQFPSWAKLPLARLENGGTDNAMFRLGDEHVVRLPRRPGAVASCDKERRWLPRVGPQLPVAAPQLAGTGHPGAGFPWNWAIYTWCPGDPATPERLTDPEAFAVDLAGFVAALQGIDPDDGPAPGEHNFGRGVQLAERDAATRAAIAELTGLVEIDTAAILAAWERALAARPWTGEGRWIHGDLQGGNLLQSAGRLAAVIDFGGLGVGDPAVDLLPAWNLLIGPARELFRARLGADADDDLWERGKGWALSVAVIALPYYLTTNPVLVASSWFALRAVLDA